MNKNFINASLRSFVARFAAALVGVEGAEAGLRGDLCESPFLRKGDARCVTLFRPPAPRV